MTNNSNESSKKDKKVKICVIAGAGAEVPYNIVNGEQFAKITVGIKDEITKSDVTAMNDAIKRHYNACLNELSKEKKDWYPKSHYNTNINIEQLLKAALIDRRVDQQDEVTNKGKRSEEDSREIEKYKNYLSTGASGRERDAQIEAEIKDLLENHISYKGIFDKEFFSLLSPRSYGTTGFWKIINMYTRAYLCIVKEFVDMDYQTILSDPVETMKQVKQKCEEMKDDNAYYQFLRGRKDVALVTTNYTPLASLKTKLGKNRIAYVNGRIGWFESAYQMRAFDLVDDKGEDDDNDKGEDKDNGDDEELNEFLQEKDLYFPYIFTQSATKPIVEEKMVNEYLKAQELMEEAERIIIIGYNINSDDNHLNTQIRRAVMKGTKLTYMAYKCKTEDISKIRDSILRKLHIGSETKINIEVVRFENNSDFADCLEN